MVNTLQTIKNIHEAFPLMDINEVLKIMECISETADLGTFGSVPVPFSSIADKCYLGSTLTNDSYSTNNLKANTTSNFLNDVKAIFRK